MSDPQCTLATIGARPGGEAIGNGQEIANMLYVAISAPRARSPGNAGQITDIQTGPTLGMRNMQFGLRLAWWSF